MRVLPLGHVLAALFATGTQTAPATPDNTLKVALISGLAAVVAAAITAFAATFQKSRPIEQFMRTEQQLQQDDVDLETELRRRAETAEDLVMARDRRIAQLERYLYVNHIDPETGSRFS